MTAGTHLSRRALLGGAAAAAVLAAAGGVAWLRPVLFARHYPPTPYDDIIAAIQDREAAARIGARVIAARPGFDAAATARAVRAKMSGAGVAGASARDAAAGRMTEAARWLLPDAMADAFALCAVSMRG